MSALCTTRPFSMTGSNGGSANSACCMQSFLGHPASCCLGLAIRCISQKHKAQQSSNSMKDRTWLRSQPTCFRSPPDSRLCITVPQCAGQVCHASCRSAPKPSIHGAEGCKEQRGMRRAILLPAHRRALHDLDVRVGRAADGPIPAVLQRRAQQSCNAPWHLLVYHRSEARLPEEAVSSSTG